MRNGRGMIIFSTLLNWVNAHGACVGHTTKSQQNTWMSRNDSMLSARKMKGIMKKKESKSQFAEHGQERTMRLSSQQEPDFSKRILPHKFNHAHCNEN